MEAHDIFKNKTRLNTSLNILMSSEKYRTLFARLVAIRIKLSAFLSGLNYQLDRNYKRLLEQQAMVLSALNNKFRRQDEFMQRLTLTPEQIIRRERGFRRFNYINGSF